MRTHEKAGFLFIFCISMVMILRLQVGRDVPITVISPNQNKKGRITTPQQEVQNHDVPISVIPLNQNKTGITQVVPEYLARCQPDIVPGGTVFYRGGGYLDILYQSECLGPLPLTPCREKAKKQILNLNKMITHIKGDVIIVRMSEHYFHFFFETFLQLWGLHIHKTLEKLSNPTILAINMQGSLRPFGKPYLEMLKLIWPEFPTENVMIEPEKNEWAYKVDESSKMVITKHNDYHNKEYARDYNFWLLDSIRETFNIVQDPKDEIFISRKGYRRAIDREDELYAALSAIIPNLRRILPDDYSVSEQAKIFANAKLIISPHGACLTNVVFSNWDKLVLIEITKGSGASWPTFKQDLQVKQHYLLRGHSPPCTSDDEEVCNQLRRHEWDTNTFFNVTKAVEHIKDIHLGNRLPSEYINLEMD